MLRAPVVCFFTNYNPLPGFCKGFGTDAGTASTTNDDNIGLHGLGLCTRGKLYEAVFISLAWLAMDWCGRKAESEIDSWAGASPGSQHQALKGFCARPKRFEVRLRPTLHDLLPDIRGLEMEGGA